MVTLAILPTTNDEVTAWAETSAFRRDILSTSWVVGDQDLSRARRKAEGLERHERHMAEKRRRKQKNLAEELMRETKKDKASHRRRRTEGEGRINVENEHGQGKGKGRKRGQQQREKMEEHQMERAKAEDGLMMTGQDEEGEYQRKTRSSGRVHRGEVRIPKDQQDLLNREEFLLSDGTIVRGKGKELMSKTNWHSCPSSAGKYDALGL